MKLLSVWMREAEMPAELHASQFISPSPLLHRVTAALFT